MTSHKHKGHPLTRYELPPDGISLLGYIVRRMHKTALLAPVADLLSSDRPAAALAQVAFYAAAASASFGPAYYQPRFDQVGDEVTEPDPATGATVTATLEARRPHFKVAYSVALRDGTALTGTEQITGTTISLRGLGMPAPSQFRFAAAGGAYTAQLTGTIVSELLPGLLRRSRIRARGSLQLRDSAGNAGKLTLTRRGALQISLSTPSGATVIREFSVPRTTEQVGAWTPWAA